MSSFVVSVSREQLLTKLRENRERHLQMYQESRVGFCKQARRTFERKIQELEEGKLSSLSVRLHPPENHQRDYDRVIGQLEMSTQEEIEINEDQYAAYVQDDWNWMAGWLMSNRGMSQTADDYAATKSYLFSD